MLVPVGYRPKITKIFQELPHLLIRLDANDTGPEVKQQLQMGQRSVFKQKINKIKCIFDSWLIRGDYFTRMALEIV